MELLQKYKLFKKTLNEDIEDNGKEYIHYSHAKNQSRLIGRSSGTGIKGAEQERLKLTKDSRIRNRVYFYPPVAGGYPQPEPGLGPHMYQTKLHNMHDATKQNEATLRIASKQKEHIAAGEHPLNAYERAVVDSGFHGYHTADMSVVLNHDVNVKYIGHRDGKNLVNIPMDTKEKVKSIMTSFPSSEGEHSSSNLTPDQSMYFLNHKASIKSAAPSAKLQYGKLYVHKNDIENFKNHMEKNHQDHPF